MRRMTGFGAVGCALGGVLLLLGACTTGGAGSAPTVVAAAVADDAEPTPSATPSAVPHGTVATGTLTSDNGTTGTVRVDFDGELLTLVIDDLVTPTQVEVNALMSVQPVPVDQTCYDSGMRLSLGPTRADDGGVPLIIGDLDFFMGDPSGIDQLILTTTIVDLVGSPDCLATIVARADIDWEFSPRRSYLAPVDSGETGGAMGDVETLDGASVAYTVVPGDLIEEVAARLGITVDDLFYLNTSRVPASQQTTLRVGERLNLLVSER